MSTFLADLADTLEHQAQGLMGLRRCSAEQAWQAMRATFVENLTDSRGTTQEDYWIAALDVADRKLAGLNAAPPREIHR